MQPFGIQTEKLSLAQTAHLCGVSRVTVWRWIKTGNLKSTITERGHHRITENDLLDYIKERVKDCGAGLFLEKPLQTDRVIEIVKKLLPAPSAQAAA